MGVNTERCAKLLNKFITGILISALLVANSVLTVYLLSLGLTWLGMLGSSYFVGAANTYFWIVYGVCGTYSCFRSLGTCVEHFTKNS